MDINLTEEIARAIGIAHLRRYGVTSETFTWQRYVSIALNRMTLDEVNELKEMVKTHEHLKGAKVALKDIDTWLAAMTAPEGQKVRKLEHFESILTEYLLKAPGHRLYRRYDEEGDLWLCFYVTKIEYHEEMRNERQGTIPAHVTMDYIYERFGSQFEKEVTFWVEDVIKRTVGEVLTQAGFYIETDELRTKYIQEVTRYRLLVPMIGRQFLARGLATDEIPSEEDEHHYRERKDAEHRLMLGAGDTPAKVVVDVFREKYYDARASSQRPDAGSWFWAEAERQMKKRVDEKFVDPTEDIKIDERYSSQTKRGLPPEDLVEDIDVFEVPVHPFLVIFDLQKHLRLSVHVASLTEYVYDRQLSEKLVLPEHIKRLIQMLVEHRSGGFRDIVAGKAGGAIILLTGPPGVGKCHRKGQKLILYDGTLRAVEDLVVGDKLMGPDSKPREILSLARGRAKMVEIRPTKGQPFVVNEDHILTLVRTNGLSHGKLRVGGNIIDISVKDYLRWNTTRKHDYLLFNVPVDFPNPQPLQMKPYFMGILLGDGGLSHGQGKRKGTPNITTMHPEIASEVARQATFYNLNLRAVHSGRAMTYFLTQGQAGGRVNTLSSVLAEMGLMPIACADKFIPHNYKTASRSDRLELLAGLMDTDGNLVIGHGCYGYITKSKRLAEDIAFVARSVGLRVTMRPCKKYAQNGNGGTYHRLIISGDINMIPCRVSYKKAPARRQKKSALRAGFNVRYVSEDEEYYGFTLSGDGHYLLDEFLVTHNTLTAEVFSEAQEKSLYSVQASQLGTDPEVLERNLLKCIARANRWRAIFLLDEADVYVHKRGDNLDQNAIVGVFLRVLEYQDKSVMFLTTNRPDLVDDAIASRCVARIDYEYPTVKEQEQIWSILAAISGIKLDPAVSKAFAESHSNTSGRDVKNLLKLAKLFSDVKGEKITVKSLEYVLKFKPTISEDHQATKENAKT